MGTKIDSNVAGSSIHGDALGTQAIIEEKYAWQQERGWQFNSTLDVKRYTETSGDPSAHIQPTRTQVTSVGGVSLESMPCTVDEYKKTYEHRWGGVAEAGDRVFVIYDVEVLPSDRIEYDGNVYEPVSVDYRRESGRCEILARRASAA